MKNIKQALLCNLLLLAALAGSAQVKFGNNPTVVNPNSLLELESGNQGLLLPRLTLTQTSLPAPLTAHVQGMTVFNTATVNDVKPGIYYNDGTKWVSVSTTLPTNQYWNLAGNAGTTAGTNFIGTTDNADLVFKINDSVSGWINSSLLNSSYGYNSLQITSTGKNNSAFGFNALNSNTIGNQNTAIGSFALQSSTTGYLNTAVGASALQYNVFGGLNTAFGTQSMQQNFSGINNTAVGYISLSANQNGNYNTAIGGAALGANVNSNDNTAVGYQSLQNNVSGSDNTTVGYNAGSTLNSGTNNIVIGSNSQPSSVFVSNEVTIGNPSNNSFRIYGAWVSASDIKLKHNIKKLPVGLSFIMGLKPVEFVYNNANDETKSLGFIAQDVIADMQSNKMGRSYGLVTDMDEKNLGLRTDEIIPILTKAIQEQQKIIEDQNKRLERLERLLLNK